MFERFTDRARNAVRQARSLAGDLGHEQVGTEHLLLALLQDEASLAAKVLRGAGLDFTAVRDGIERARRDAQVLGDADAAALREIGIDLDAVRAKLAEAFGPDALRAPEPEPTRWPAFLRRRARESHSRFSARAKKALELSLREALRLKHNYIGTEHILLGLIREGGGPAALALQRTGLSLDGLRNRVLDAVKAAA